MVDQQDTMSSTALVVMDYQRAVVQMLPQDMRAAVLANTAALLAWSRQAGIPRIFVTVGMRAGYPEVSGRNRIFSRLKAASLLQADDPQTAMHPDALPLPDEPMVVKRRVGAFSGTDLEGLLRAMNVRQLVLAGLLTSGVVLSTVRAAADLDFSIVVVDDACADSDPDVHALLMQKVFPKQATVVKAADLIERGVVV
ncbi:N/A [soil metagenome]